MGIQDRIAQAIEESGSSKSAIAKACGVSPSSVTQWLSGDTKAPTAERLLCLARVTRVSLTWLIEGKGPMRTDSNIEHAPPQIGVVPVLSWVQAGAWTEIEQEAYDPESSDWAPRPLGASEETFALRVVGESMQPDYRPGYIIYVDPCVRPESGDDVVATLPETDEATFKRLVLEPGGSMMLMAVNPDWPHRFIEIASYCQIVGTVIATMMPRRR